MTTKFTQLITIVALFSVILVHANDTTNGTTPSEATKDDHTRARNLNASGILDKLIASSTTLYFRLGKCSVDGDCKCN